ncbi:hypothetical protein DJ010_05410 [Nocardioides silvaticus]|uniref:Uncharacterized protein n=1 Tax=Nocardioides silvaticus TaxID=2201891 RepID=A0A316TGA0_9ACTN|nr:hypothetical protein [Nocardioides silvaticus]PWN03547.1 hypothetical protein DJ010_05410 [Nocardioides silvaticus]
MAREDDQESADLARERELEWQQIVENFGERAVLDPEDVAPVEPEPVGFEREDDDEPSAGDQVPLDEEFVPPTPPPLPRPPLDRLLAWCGVFGVPALVLVCIVAGISVPSWFGLLLAAAFVGGFGYLVMKMSDEPRDPWDDGAVL